MHIRFFLILLFVFFIGGCTQFTKGERVCFDKQCIAIEVAKTPDQRSKGLQGRKKLGKNEGMLFVFRYASVYPFWMKNTLIPLDIIWFNYKKEVIHIEKNVPPCQKNPCPLYMSKGFAQYVLEVNGGRADELNIEIGSQAHFFLNK